MFSIKSSLHKFRLTECFSLNPRNITAGTLQFCRRNTSGQHLAADSRWLSLLKIRNDEGYLKMDIYYNSGVSLKINEMVVSAFDN